MTNTYRFVSVAATALLLASCQKELQEDTTPADLATRAAAANPKGIAGQVYTLTNAAAGNEVWVFDRTAGGQLSFAAAYPTGGAGTGSGLGSQGAVVLSASDQWLLAVNAGSNSITSFRVDEKALEWVSTVASGGTLPISITAYNDLVYVLNAGGSGNISGFRLHSDGTLHPLEGSTRPLTSSSAGPAEVAFVADGSALVVTEKAANLIVSYSVTDSGVPGILHTLPSANATPFGFAVGKNGAIYVSEAAGGAPGASTVSSYRVGSDGTITLLDGPVSAGQSAACWVAASTNGKYVYASNTGSHTISSFTTDHTGDLQVLQAGVATAPGRAPGDAALSNNSKFLYVLHSGTESIEVFSVEPGGRLTHIQHQGGLPDGAVGMAAH